MSLRTHLLVGLGVVALALAVGFAIIVGSVRAGLIRQVDSQLVRAVEPARHLVPGDGVTDSSNVTSLPLSSLNVVFVPGRNGTGSPVQLTGDSSEGPLGVSPTILRRAASSREAITIGSASNDTHFRILARSVSSPRGVLVIAASLTDVDDTLARLVAVQVIATGSVLTILGLVAWWVVGLGIRPIKRMTTAAAAIAGGEVTTRVPEADPSTEAGQLGTALNSMLERIEEAFTEQQNSDQRLRRFAADASHELRTPLATIRGYTELYRSGGLSAPGMLPEAIGRIESETIRMSELVDELLLLARLDQRRPLERVDVPLPTLLRELVADARAAHPERSVELSVDDETTVLRADPALVRRAIGNALANALQYTPATSPITLSMSGDATRVVVEVSDDGPGMSPDTAKHAFDRFYRADTSRSRGHGGNNLGLGLAILSEAVEAHGGTATLQSTVEGGTTVRCGFPVVEPGSVTSPAP